MFDLPNAKRVRRDELNSPPSSPAASSPTLSAQDANARLARLLDFETYIPPLETNSTTAPGQPTTNPDSADKNSAVEEQEQEFEFRLFSNAPAKRKTGDSAAAGTGTDGKGAESGERTQKLRIRIRSPTPGPVSPGEGRFVVPFRGWEYYFTTPALLARSGPGQQGVVQAEERVASKRKEYEDVAVSGKDLFDWTKRGTWPGCHLPWRVIQLKRSNTKLPPPSADPTLHLINPTAAADSTSPKSRKKPGKKRRVVLRKRAAAAEAAKMTEAEKRNKKNREKKIKKRQKAREQKAALAAAGGDAPESGEMERDGGASETGSDD